MKNLDNSRVIIAVGAGGVGKTTVASALGLYFAKRGEKTLVITIDPARRLLDAMGVREISDEPSRVNLTEFGGDGCVGGELFVFMPNLKKEWLSFLEAAVAHSDVRDKIAANHFYQYMADGMPGALEIICSHILYRIEESGRFDKIILDTPPTSHSISFFDVPKKITRVLEQGVFRMLMSKRNSMLAKITKKLAFFSGGILQSTVERIIGSHFLSELIEFALSIDALYEPLLHRVRAMDSLLQSRTTKYALILKPTVASVRDSATVKTALHDRGISINQIIINQVMPMLDLDAVHEEMRSLSGSQSEQGRVVKLVELYEKEIALEEKMLATVHAQFPHHNRKLLFMSEITKSRAAMLTQLVENLGAGET